MQKRVRFSRPRLNGLIPSLKQEVLWHVKNKPTLFFTADFADNSADPKASSFGP